MVAAVLDPELSSLPGPGTRTENVAVDPVTERLGTENVLSGSWKTAIAIVFDRCPQLTVSGNVPVASSGI